MAIATTITALVKEEIDPAAMACQEELILDGHKIKTINEEDSQTLSQFETLKSLSMNQTYLTSVAGLPLLPNLEVLELADNKLGAGSSLEIIAQRCPKLTTLILAGNRLTDLTFLKGFGSLEVLDVDVNPLTASKQAECEVRVALFKEFPNLKVVNSRDRDGNDVEDAEPESDSDEESDSDQGPRIVGDDVEKKRDSAAPKGSLLKSFYEKDYNHEEEDDDDEEDFNPDSFEDSEEECSDDDDEDEEEQGATDAPDQEAKSDQAEAKVKGEEEKVKDKSKGNTVSKDKADKDKQKVGIGLADAHPKEDSRKRKSEPQQDDSRRKKRV